MMLTFDVLLKLALLLISVCPGCTCTHCSLICNTFHNILAFSTAMETLDWRMGIVRRVTAPAAPRPINLPSQKLENEAIPQTPPPRPPFSWGDPNAPPKNSEKTDNATMLMRSNEAGDSDSNVKSIAVSTGEVEVVVEQSCSAQLVQGNTSTPSCSEENDTASPSCAASAVKTEVFPSSASIGPWKNDAEGDSESQVATEMDTVPDSLAQLVPSGSGTSLPSAPQGCSEEFPSAQEIVAQVEEQKLSDDLLSSPIQSWAEECEKVSSPQPEEGEFCSRVPEFENGQGNNWSSKLQPEPWVSECFGEFYSDYPPPNSCAGMPFVNCHETPFGSALYAGAFPCDGVYSSLGVPYYDSARNKEVVVITMVGNPGLYGNYLPSPGVPDQFATSAGVFGNTPLQFGQFEHPVIPGPAIFNGGPPAFSGEQGECAYYEEDYLKYHWGTNGHMLQRNVNGRMPTSFSTFSPAPCSEGHGAPTGAGRQRPAYRTRKVTTKESWKPERRVTLLTKGSQHELIINSFEKRGKPGGGSWRDSGLSASKKCEAQCNGVELCGVHEAVDMDNSLPSRALTSFPTADEVSSRQATQTEAKVSSETSKKDCAHSQVAGPTQSSSTFQARDKDAVLPGLPSPSVPCQNPEINSRIEGRDVSKCDVTNVTCNVDSNSSMPSDFQLKCQSVNSIEEQAINNAHVLKTTTIEILPIQRTNGSVPGVSNHRCNRTWRRKVSTAVAQLGEEEVSGVAKEVAVLKEVAAVKEVALDEKDSSRLHTQTPGNRLLDAAPTSASGSMPMPQSDSISASVGGQASVEAKEDCHHAVSTDCSDSRDMKSWTASFQTGPLGMVGTLDSIRASQKSVSQSAKEHSRRIMSAPKWVKEWRQKQASADVGPPISIATTVSDPRSSTNARKLQKSASQGTPSMSTCSGIQNRLKACSSDGLTKKSECQKSPLKSPLTEEVEEQNSFSALCTVDKNEHMVGLSHLQGPQPLQPVASLHEKEGLLISQNRVEKKEQTLQIVKKQKSDRLQPGENKHGKTEPLMSREASSTQLQSVHVPESQAASAHIPVLTREDNSISKPVKSGGHHTSWRRKAVPEKSGMKNVFDREVKEKDPQAFSHKEGRAKQQAEVLLSSEFATSSDAQKGSKTSSGCDGKFHIEGAHQDMPQKKVPDSKGSRSPIHEREVKRAAGPMKQGGATSSPGKNAKQPIYVSKQIELNQPSTAGKKRRPFSTRSNFCYDEDEALPHHVRSSCTSPSLQQAQVLDSSCVGRETSSYMETRRDTKLARRGRLHVGWRVSEKGWAIKKEMMEIVV